MNYAILTRILCLSFNLRPEQITISTVNNTVYMTIDAPVRSQSIRRVLQRFGSARYLYCVVTTQQPAKPRRTNGFDRLLAALAGLSRCTDPFTQLAASLLGGEPEMLLYPSIDDEYTEVTAEQIERLKYPQQCGRVRRITTCDDEITERWFTEDADPVADIRRAITIDRNGVRRP